ncbi:hypothetical protein [Bacteroides sp.]|uniref:hypothetical protein n=1 Tax=Bacteroides sp. TaxID=29523 RepID=UPI0025C12E95|nr:hypothetical protein [Bacteroides sp.]
MKSVDIKNGMKVFINREKTAPNNPYFATVIKAGNGTSVVRLYGEDKTRTYLNGDILAIDWNNFIGKSVEITTKNHLIQGKVLACSPQNAVTKLTIETTSQQEEVDIEDIESIENLILQ